MIRYRNVVHLEQFVVRVDRFLLEHVEPGTSDLALLECLDQCFLIDHRST